MDKDKLAVEGIRRRNAEHATLDAIGGVREWFDIAFLLRYIDKLEAKQAEVVNSDEELDALPGDSMILTEQGGYWLSIKRQDGLNWWTEPGRGGIHPSVDLTLPATVLVRGE